MVVVVEVDVPVDVIVIVIGFKSPFQRAKPANRARFHQLGFGSHEAIFPKYPLYT